jgi:Na+/melibiose symporter-like transporter
VFLINVIPGTLGVGLVWFAWQSSVPARTKKVSVDYAGAGLLTLAALSLLLGLDQLGSPLSWLLLAGFLLLSVLLMWVERRASDPMLPLHLFKDRLFNVSLLHGVFAGWAMFGSLSYVPLFVQAVLGTSATQAGITLTPMSLAWTLSSILGGRLLLKMGYRTLSLFGMVLLCAGTFLMTLINPASSQILIMIYLSLMGIGMGLSIPAFLIAVQSTVRKQDLGAATSTVQFSRSIGGTLGVSVLGALLSSGFASRLLTAGLNPATVSLDSLIDPVATTGAAAMSGPVREALSGSIASLFIVASVAAVLGLVVVMFAPGGRIAQLMESKLVKDSP